MTSELPRIVGADIGGANLKFATDDRVTRTCTFRLWQQPEILAETIVSELADIPQVQKLAVTMTGEMADCFRDRAAGVKHIVQHTQQAAKKLNINEVTYYGVDGQFRGAAKAIHEVEQVSSANWHALASFVGSEIKPDALLVDIGSTTTDVIPIKRGTVAIGDRTDHDRLCSAALVYVGCRRTPVCALVEHFPIDGSSVPVMNELFATIDDAMLLLSLTNEAVDDCDTADGNPRTKVFAQNRLARMIGLDGHHLTGDHARTMSHAVIDAARCKIDNAVQTFLTGDPIVTSGHGQSLFEFGDAASVIDLNAVLGPEVSRCAPAYAVARLAAAVPAVQ